MPKRIMSGIVVAIILASLLELAINVKPIAATGTISIKADGSIDPPTANITTADSINYYFTNHNYAGLFINRSNIVVDGNGYSLQGSGDASGISISVNNVTIKNVEVNNFWFGISIMDSANNKFIGNNITGNANDGIHLFRTSNNTFKNNSITENKYSFKVSGSQIAHYIQDIDRFNSVNGKPMYYLVNQQNFEVPHDAGYTALVNCNNITVKDLELRNNGEGVILVNTTNSMVFNNTLIQNHYDSVFLRWSSNNTISENNITGSSMGVRLMSQETNGNTISRNVVTDCSYGVYLYYLADGNIISNNTITNNLHGILLQWVHNNTVVKNNVTNNSFEGIWLLPYYDGINCLSTNNTIIENNIYSNNIGVRIEEASNNSFFHNSFISNIQQILVNPSGYFNNWDNGYPSGGNYWGDYNGTDFSSGPFQNETGSDGIGDTPYIIDENNTDRYPLVPLYPNNTMHWDITGSIMWVPDGKCDIRDVAVVALRFGSQEGDEVYDVRADITGPEYCVSDGKIDIRDVALVALHFGEDYTLT